MAFGDIAQITEALAKTHVGEVELSYKGRGLKLDNAESVKEIVEDIERCQGLQSLRLEGNTLGVEAADAIAKSLEAKRELEQCHWSDMFTGRLRSEIPPALKSLGNALMTSGARLTQLDLSDNAFGPDGVKGIENLLKSSACYTLQELRLNNCGMGSGGGVVLASALTECHKQSSAAASPLRLKVFIAGRNRLENDGATALAKAFKLLGSLEEVHMPQNGINHPGITALAAALKHNPNLQVLNLNDNTFTTKGSKAMAEAIRHLQCLKAINFGDCLVRSEGAIAIAGALREGLHLLRELNLSFGEICEAAAMVVAKAVQGKADLEKLDLNGNCFGEDGCEALKEAMEKMNMEDLLCSLSDDEGEPDEEDNDDDDDDEEEDEDDDDDAEEKEGNDAEENGLNGTKDVIEEKEEPPHSSELMSFLVSPSAEKLISLGAKRVQLIEQQVDVTDANKVSEVFLKISSVYKDEPEVKQAVFETTDALLRKAFSNSPHSQSYSFISSLMVNLGLLKSEDKKVKKVSVLPGHLLTLEHAVSQEFFPADQAGVLESFVSRKDKMGSIPTWPVIILFALKIHTALSAKCPKVCVCDSIQLTIACVNKNLTEVPPTIDEITVKLDLRGNDLQELPTGAFAHTPYLTHLSLQNSNIRRVREGAFRKLGRLVLLNLANNKIEILYQESFDGLSSLKQLIIDRNRVEEIQPGAFSQLGFLNLLSLTHNQLVYIPNMAFQGLQNIKWLRLSHNFINYLATEAFAGLFTLTRLSLDNNELQFFPTETMTRLSEVTRLELSFNPMTYLGEESVSMLKLTHLLLDHNSLQDFSNAAILLSPRLTHLDLSHNQLRILQPMAPGSPKLTRLNLAGNPIYCSCYLRPLREWATRERVRLGGTCGGPAHLSGENLEVVQPVNLRCLSQEAMLKAELEEQVLPALPTTPSPKKGKCPANCACETENRHSSCENKGHTKIPRGFSPDTRLLDLRGNHFHYIPANSFPGTAEVVSLHLQRCKIHDIEDGAFSGMKSLVYLYLSENDLTSLTPEAFKGLPHLTYLHLEKNRFTQFPKGAFKLLPGLLALHMENNAIAKLETGLLTSAEKLRGLYLTSNAITAAAPQAFNPAPDLETLHLGSNKLQEVPTEAFSKARSLAELKLSHNPIRWIGAGAFQPVGTTLRHLYLDHMGLEKVSTDFLAGLGSGLRSLLLEGNQLEELPDLSPLTGLEVINLAENPLLCDCPLLPLRKWIEQVNLKVRATCGNQPELRGQRVKDVHVFKSCPGGKSPSAQHPKPTRAPKPESARVSPPKIIKRVDRKATGKSRKGAKPHTVQKTAMKKRKSA